MSLHFLKNNTYEFGVPLSLSEVLNPYLNEHAARLRDPNDFDPKTFRRTAGGTIYGTKKVPVTIHIIWGKLKGRSAPADQPIPQALRFPIKNWTEAEARKWLKDNKINYLSFEPAKEEKDKSTAANKNSWYKIRDAGQESEIYILEEIGYMGITAKRFIEDFKKILNNKIRLHINSPGGSVFQGITIHNTLKNSGKEINVYIDGLTASIASVIAMAGTKIFMPENALLMIHEATAGSEGRAEDHRKTAEILEKINGQIAGIYAEKSGKTAEEIRAAMKEESWFTGSEALDYGLVDETTEALKAVALCNVEKSGFKNLSKFMQLSKLQKTELNSNNNKTLTEREAEKMDLTQLKLEHPAIADALIDEGKTAGRTEGANAERERIKAILALNAADTKDIVTAAIDKPEETAGTVAVAILKKRETANKANKDALNKENKDLSQKLEDVGQGEGSDKTAEQQKKEKEEKEEKDLVDKAAKAGSAK